MELRALDRQRGTPMKILLVIPHVFAPKPGGIYSSQTEEKRQQKTNALKQATHGNLNRHRQQHWIHASLGKNKAIVTRRLNTSLGSTINVQLYTPPSASLAETLAEDVDLIKINPDCEDLMQVPMKASRRLLEQASEYDLLGYLEDDLLIEDYELFAKIKLLVDSTGGDYVFLPHRCEHIPGHGDVILSGDPDGGRPDLFWDTGETIQISWGGDMRQFYRATNPHSGCFFLTKHQALKAYDYWDKRNWMAPFTLSGPLEQAGSGMLLPIFKLMKPIPEHYRFLMIRHLDKLWKMHPFEKQRE